MLRRGLLLLGGLVLLPALAHAGDTEDKAIQAIEKVGGSVVRDEDAPGKPVVEVDYGGEAKVTDGDLKPLAAFKQVRVVLLDGTSVTDAGLQHLGNLTRLEELDLADTKVTGPGLKHLILLKALKVLYLDGT